MDFNNIQGLINDLELEVDREIEGIIEDIFNTSQHLVPVDTGELKRSGTFTKNEVYYSTAYSDIVEMDRGFLRSSYLQNLGKTEPRISNALQRAIKMNER